MKNVYVVHYNEIALKGRNRPDFLRKLQENICKATGLAGKEVRIVSGRLLVGISDNTECFRAQHSVLDRALSRIFGISSFSPAVLVQAKYEEIEKAIEKIINNKKSDNTKILYSILVLSDFESFAIRVTRGDKKFVMTSQELNEKLGSFVYTKFNKKVDLTNPDVTFYVEVFTGGNAERPNSHAERGGVLVYTEKISGAGGMPVGMQGKAVALLSGGIDSPVATHRLMKRGTEIIGAHFHSYPFTTRASIDKVKELAGVLKQYGGLSQVYFIPIAEAQKEIVKNCDERYRVLLYRRLMFRIAQELAIQQGARALITGESLGQVASQTMENIAVVEQAVRMPVFRPLIGYDKQEIITEAQRIGTYEISIQPHDDCCSLFMPKQVATRARLQDVEKEEQKIEIKKLINGVLLKVERSCI